jgi:BlaI family transcriptional regulator, penicillinase repressor
MKSALLCLGTLECEVMRLVWDGGSITAQAVRAQLKRKLKESTIRTVLRRLEAKGYVTHAVTGRSFVYRAALTRGQAAAKAIQGIAGRFCGGSVEEVLVAMLDSAMLNERHLRFVANKFNKVKK